MTPEEAMETLASDKRSNKPMMEKRRRARINASLAELKALLIDFMKTEGSRHSKMEKADILEMTVRHLRQLQRQQYSGSTEPTQMAKFHAGYNECASQLSNVLSNTGNGVDLELRTRLLTHLANTIHVQNSSSHDGDVHSSSPHPTMPHVMDHMSTVMTSQSSPPLSEPHMKMIKLDDVSSSQYLSQSLEASNPQKETDSLLKHKYPSRREQHNEPNARFNEQTVQNSTLGYVPTLGPLPAPRLSTPTHPLAIQTMPQGVQIMTPAQNGNLAIVIPSNFLNGTNCLSIPLYATFANSGPIQHSSPKRADTIEFAPMDTQASISVRENKLDGGITVKNNTDTSDHNQRFPAPADVAGKASYDSDMWRPW
ncbi:unnamed protein product [Owenia fusiformis]|uniref:Uncharacterized protein n=1 Tax=Owenia fusiformis TaxID=6347 RepID=A0A8S4N248_OWEFU|nr:unnamed protein product [Owenia fusiformis]